MLDIIIQAVSLISSVGAIWLCSSKASSVELTDSRRHWGCVVGALIATPINLYLTHDGPMSVFLLTVICGVIYLRGISFPAFLRWAFK